MFCMPLLVNSSKPPPTSRPVPMPDDQRVMSAGTAARPDTESAARPPAPTSPRPRCSDAGVCASGASCSPPGVGTGAGVPPARSSPCGVAEAFDARRSRAGAAHLDAVVDVDRRAAAGAGTVCSTSTLHVCPGAVVIGRRRRRRGHDPSCPVVVPGTIGWVNFVPAGGCGFTSMSMSPCAVGGATGCACPGMPPGEASCAWATPHPNTSAITLIAATIPLFMPLPFPSKPPTTTAPTRARHRR